MKKTRRTYSIGILILLFAILSLALFFLSPKTSREILRFEEEFGLKLPEGTRVVFNEDDHGALGDGTRLYIYQLTAAGMSGLKQQQVLNSWWVLPFNEKLALGLVEKIKGVSSDTIAGAMRFGSDNGYYFIKNRYNKPLKGFDFNDISYSNIVIGVIDSDNCRIYYFTLDM